MSSFEKPCSHAGAVHFGGQTMAYIPKKDPYLRWLLGDIPPHGQSVLCSAADILIAVTDMIGSIQAAEAIKYLLGIGEIIEILSDAGYITYNLTGGYREHLKNNIRVKEES